jgi:hypothetical protein
MAQKPWIVPILGTGQISHLLENIGAAQIEIATQELADLHPAVFPFGTHGARLPESVLQRSFRRWVCCAQRHLRQSRLETVTSWRGFWNAYFSDRTAVKFRARI